VLTQCCSVLRGVLLGSSSCCTKLSVCCSMLQSVAVCCSVLRFFGLKVARLEHFASCCACVATCCRVSQCVAARCSVLLESCSSCPFFITLCVCSSALLCAVDGCRVLQCAAVCCSVLQCVAVFGLKVARVAHAIQGGED